MIEREGDTIVLQFNKIDGEPDPDRYRIKPLEIRKPMSEANRGEDKDE
jgi:hypothetical protein